MTIPVLPGRALKHYGNINFNYFYHYFDIQIEFSTSIENLAIRQLAVIVEIQISKSWKAFHGYKIQIIVKQMIKENPLWGAPILHGELLKLGIVISERTVSKMVKKYKVGKPPSQTWLTFLKNHMNSTYAIDFFTVPTANFKLLYVFVILWHERRKAIHFNVTMNPTAQWTALQIGKAKSLEYGTKISIKRS